MLIWSDPVRLPTFKTYAENHPNVDATIDTVAGDTFATKVQLAVRAKSGVPDALFAANTSLSAVFASKRQPYGMDLTDNIPKEIQAQFTTNANSPCLFNGRLMCLRNDTAHNVIWYNRPLLTPSG